VGGQSREANIEALSELIRTSISSDEPLMQRPSDRRILVHAQVAMRLLEVDESVQFAALRNFDATRITLVLGDSVLVLTDRAMVITRVPVIPVASLSRAKRHEFDQVEAVTVEARSPWPNRLRVDLRGEGSEAFSLSPPGKAEAAAQLIQPHNSPASGAESR
jgi:hypothetical protein